MFVVSAVRSSTDIEQYLPAPLDLLFPPLRELRRGPLELRGEFWLLETEARGAGLVRPRLLSPEPLHGVTVIVTGEEEPAGGFTIVNLREL